MHLATLYHDDVMDEAMVRRGADSANARWGNNIAILAGDYLFATASRLVSQLGPDAVRVIADTFAQLVTGQMRETRGGGRRRRLRGALPQGRVREDGLPDRGVRDVRREVLGGRRAADRAARPLGGIVGTAFQISDDIIDIDSDPDESGKLPGTDLREGVHTLPVLYALRDTGPDADRLRQLLKGPIEDDAEVAEALALLRSSRGIARAKETVARYATQARDELAQLPDVPGRVALANLIDYTINRDG